MEAVGIEPSPERPGSRDSVAITRKGVDEETLLKPGECALADPLRTRVQNLDSLDAVLARTRLAWGMLRVI